VSRFKNNVRISDKELELLETINSLGACSSERVHESVEPKIEYLIVMRMLHALVEKGFLQRIIINQKQLYRTSRNYAYIKSFLNSPKA
jgi:predicted transcriptional regulator